MRFVPARVVSGRRPPERRRRLGPRATADRLLRRASEASRDDFNVHYLLGVTLLKLHRPDDALRA